jgi:hypothetical protein
LPRPQARQFDCPGDFAPNRGRGSTARRPSRGRQPQRFAGNWLVDARPATPRTQSYERHRSKAQDKRSTQHPRRSSWRWITDVLASPLFRQTWVHPAASWFGISSICLRCVLIDCMPDTSTLL